MCVYEREMSRGSLQPLINMCESNKNRSQGTHVIWRNLEIFYKVGPATTMHSGIVLPVIIYNCCIARFFAISHDCPIVNFTLIFPSCHWNGYLKRIEISIMENFYNCQMITRVGFVNWLFYHYLYILYRSVFKKECFSLLQKHLLRAFYNACVK